MQPRLGICLMRLGRFLGMRYLVFVILVVLTTLSACSMQRVQRGYDNFASSVKSKFYRYDYKSNLETYRPASWHPAAKERYATKKLPRETKDNWKNYKVGGPYQIAGDWYYPEEDPYYEEEGEASWYGADFHNKKTANGEIFNKDSMTAAHRTLPMPSVVKVTNLENGKTVSVRVNDRGPFAKDRIIDLSEKAARKLGFHDDGTTHVKVELDRQATANLFYDPWDATEVASAKREKPTHATSPKMTTIDKRVEFYEEHYVQAGAYSTWDNAKSAARGLKGVGPVKIQESDYRGSIVYRVKVGPFPTEKDAGKALDQVAMMGFGDAIVLGE